jgi:hypothetical protein
MGLQVFQLLVFGHIMADIVQQASHSGLFGIAAVAAREFGRARLDTKAVTQALFTQHFL